MRFSLPPIATTILYPVKAGELARLGPAEVRARYGVEPRQVPDFIALRGDPSDGLPGARGVGPKGAAALLHKYPTLEDAFADGQLAVAGRAIADLPPDRDDGSHGAAARPRRPEAELGQGRRTGARLGPRPPGNAARRAGGASSAA